LPELSNNTPGAGNAYSTAHDLALFAMFYLRPRSARHPILTDDNVALMTSYVNPDAFYPFYDRAHYGLGWYIREEDAGFKTVWHEGGMPGASSYIKMVPKAQIAAAALTNVGDQNPLVDSLVNDLIKVVLPSYQPEPLNATANYKLYSGAEDYRGTWSGIVKIRGVDVPCSLAFDENGDIRVSYGKRGGADTPTVAKFRGLVQGPSFIGSFSAPWPSEDIPHGVAPLLVMHLIKDGKVLSGRVNAYEASSQTLQFFYPFYVRLERDKESPAPRRARFIIPLPPSPCIETDSRQNSESIIRSFRVPLAGFRPRDWSRPFPTLAHWVPSVRSASSQRRFAT
jgi:hypothetical protein